MHHSPQHDAPLPPQIVHARWIDASDKNALSEGMRRMNSDERATFFRYCFHQQARGIFRLESDDPVGYGLLCGFLEE